MNMKSRKSQMKVWDFFIGSVVRVRIRRSVPDPNNCSFYIQSRIMTPMHEILRIIRENSVSATVIGLMLFVMCTILAFSHVGFGPDDYMIQRLTSKAARLDYDRLEFAGERVVLDE